MKAATFTKSGNKATTEVTLDKAVFEREVNNELIKQSYLRTLANQRQATSKTKTRGEIRGGGKKPWRQKGTGRARSGSIRNPLWRGGGTIFGPTGEQNHTLNLPKKALHASLAQALSLKATAKSIYVIEAFDAKDGKVKTSLELVRTMKLEGSTLLVVGKCDQLVQRATRNVQKLTATEPSALTVNAIVDAKNLVITKDALDAISQWLGVKADTKPADRAASAAASEKPTKKSEEATK